MNYTDKYQGAETGMILNSVGTYSRDCSWRMDLQNSLHRKSISADGFAQYTERWNHRIQHRGLHMNQRGKQVQEGNPDWSHIAGDKWEEHPAYQVRKSK